MKLLLLASAAMLLGAGAASAQTIPMRDGSTIVTVGGGCLVQYGARRERINNATTCSPGDISRADQILSGGGGGFGGRGFRGGRGFGGGGGGVPSGSWAASCRGGQMRGNLLHAECRTADGRWNTTVLDMRNCPTGYAENRNGSLVCR